MALVSHPLLISVNISVLFHFHNCGLNEYFIMFKHLISLTVMDSISSCKDLNVEAGGQHWLSARKGELGAD
jgi:hypothetical protein